MEAFRSMELDIDLIYQPPYSPKLNMLGLVVSTQYSFYRTRRHQRTPIGAVEKSFESLSWKKFNNVILTLEKIMEACILYDGRNNYKIPEGRKELERPGDLHVSIKVSEEQCIKICSSNVD